MTAERWFRDVAPRQRWFADKGRTVDRVAIVWSYTPRGEREFSLYVAEIRFSDGVRSRYFAALDSGGERDGTGEPAFASWLVGAVLGSVAVPTEMSWQPIAPIPSVIGVEAGRSLGVQQSNTSIRYPSDLLIKVNRRLAPGISPEVELSAVMERSTDRSSSTTTYGSLWLSLPEEPPACLAIASQFVPNLGDGWSMALDRVRRIRSTSDLDESIPEIEAIATLTSSMHRALSSDPWHDSVAPELVSEADVVRWSSSADRELDNLLADFERLRSGLTGEAARLIELVPTALPELRSRIEGFGALRGTHRIRIHGDYHLGQVLRRPDGSYVAIDFDGEPERPLSERRQKYAALRDVAGMLRSFAYVRGTIEVERARAGEALSILREWESAARDRFLTTYIAGVANEPYAFVPSSADDIRLALGALELEKAVYECRYEINNRPDWLWLPLTRLVHEA